MLGDQATKMPNKSLQATRDGASSSASQVFHGSVRLTGSPESFRGYCQGCGAFPEMYQTWQPQTGRELESEDRVKTN